MDPASTAILLGTLASFTVALLLAANANRLGRFAMDCPGAIQTFHAHPTPRIGGVSVYFATVVAGFLAARHGTNPIVLVIAVAGVPALSIGLCEDLTRRVGVVPRLAATVGSGWLACWLSDVAIRQVGVPFLDAILMVPPLAMLFTALAVGGLANAINVIDGFHGLASGTVTICLLALAAVATSCGDHELALAALVVASALGGFWLVNFPWGKLFLGDGGAYFAGFALAWLAVLLPARNPAVSPWASLLLCGYPVVEVIYSVWRRRRQRRSAVEADREHLHSLVARRIVLRRLRKLDPTLQNAAVSVLMWVIAAVPAAAAVILYRDTPLLILSAAGYVVLYHWLYRRVARHEQ